MVYQLPLISTALLSLDLILVNTVCLIAAIFLGQHDIAPFQWQGIFCPSLGAEFRPHSEPKIATFFPNTMSDFPPIFFFF